MLALHSDDEWRNSKITWGRTMCATHGKAGSGSPGLFHRSKTMVLRANCMLVTIRQTFVVPFSQRSEGGPTLALVYLHKLILHFFSQIMSGQISSYPLTYEEVYRQGNINSIVPHRLPPAPPRQIRSRDPPFPDNKSHDTCRSTA